MAPIEVFWNEHRIEIIIVVVILFIIVLTLLIRCFFKKCVKSKKQINDSSEGSSSYEQGHFNQSAKDINLDIKGILNSLNDSRKQSLLSMTNNKSQKSTKVSIKDFSLNSGKRNPKRNKNDLKNNCLSSRISALKTIEIPQKGCKTSESGDNTDISISINDGNIQYVNPRQYSTGNNPFHSTPCLSMSSMSVLLSDISFIRTDDPMIVKPNESQTKRNTRRNSNSINPNPLYQTIEEMGPTSVISNGSHKSVSQEKCEKPESYTFVGEEIPLHSLDPQILEQIQRLDCSQCYLIQNIRK